MEKIIDYFSNRNWIIANPSMVPDFIQQFGLKNLEKGKMSEINLFYKDEIDLKNFNLHGIKYLAISSPIKNFQIIEGKSTDYFSYDYCTFLSEISEVYRFKIDIWQPIMIFELYKHKKLIRSYEYSFNEDVATEQIKEFGKALYFEKLDLKLPNSGNGYDYFYYPLSIMNHLGISNEDINLLLEHQCFVYQLNESMIDKIFR